MNPPRPTILSPRLPTLRATQFGWTGSLSPRRGTFLGHKVRLEFDTRDIPARIAPPKPSASERALACHVLSRLPSILRSAAAAFHRYNREQSKEALANISDPHIWISREALEQDGPTRWAFVVGWQGAPDYGCHIEFNGAVFHQVWGGD